MLAEQIGANIQAARKAKGWSLEKLAARVKPPTSYQQLSRLEKGDRTLSVQWVERIAKALEIEPVDLITGDRPPPVFTMTEPVASEVAQMLATVALDGAEPSPDTVLVLSQILQELTETFSKYPQAFRDPAVARPVVDFAGRRFGPSAK
jgi:transcriptional regulator with XRE-family HTH domain